MDADRRILEHLEPALRQTGETEAAAMLALVARDAVSIAEPELAAALRRSLLVLAAGGDPHRELELDDRAVTTLAADLDAPGRRGELERGLRELRMRADGLPEASRVLDALLANPNRGWHALACALLAEELGG
jgi:hypothetical protein